jgi:hypothetical protein
MSKASTAQKISKQLVKAKDNPVLDPKIRFFKTHNNRINFINNPNLDPKIRFHNVVKDRRGFPVVGDSRGLTSAQGPRATVETLARDISARNSETSSVSVEAQERASSKDQTQTPTQISQSLEPEVPSSHPEGKSGLRSVADAFEARKTGEQPARNFSSTTTGNMSSELTKVLAKDASPRKSSNSCSRATSTISMTLVSEGVPSPRTLFFFKNCPTAHIYAPHCTSANLRPIFRRITG